MAREEHFVWVLVDGKPRTRLTVFRVDGGRCDLRLLRPASLTIRLPRPDPKGAMATLIPDGEAGWNFGGRVKAGRTVRVEGVMPGSYRIYLIPWSSRPRWLSTELAEGEQGRLIVEEEKPAEPAGPSFVTITGTVENEWGEPLEDAWVSCEGADEQDKLTDAGGGFWFRKPARRFPEMAAEADGYVTKRISGWGIDGSKPIRFVLHPAVLLRIPLRVPEGSALPGKAHLFAHDPDGQERHDLSVEAGHLEVPIRAATTKLRLEIDG
jgi:hypothetical protein